MTRLARPVAALAALPLLALAAPVAGAATSAPARPTAAPAIDALLDNTADVGSSLVRSPYSDSRSLKASTLGGLCGFRYPSDDKRTARVQVRFRPPSTATTLLSQEVVTYRKGGAALALHELGLALDQCSSARKVSFDDGSSATFTLRRVSVPGLLPGSVAMTQHLTAPATGGDPAVDVTDLYVYQVRHDTLSVIYAFDKRGTSAAGRKALATRAAKAAAKRLLAHA